MFPAIGDAEVSESSSSLQWLQPCCHFEFAEIQSATNNFDDSLVIGRGGFGKVYKGTIINGARLVVSAIKRLDAMSDQGAAEFWAEVEMLSKLRHSHLVSLIGYCNEGNEMILVYEYMPHGSLEDHLHKLHTQLSWLQRLNICIGAARGLDYLHTGTGIELGVIHRDVKSSNILLHESWGAKLSDFGLSKIGPKDQPMTYVKTDVKGTFGYLDPHYYRTGRLTRKSDVYAFGVVLFEVLCRKRAVDGSPDEEEWGIVGWVQESSKKGRLRHIVDSDLSGQINPKCLMDFARIAECCLHDHPKQRPTMAEVVFSLEHVLALQEKTNSSLQHAGRTFFGRMVDKFPISRKQKHSAHGGSKLSSNNKDNNTRARKTATTRQNPSDCRITSPSLREFKFADLRTATSDFSVDMLLREDGLGKLFLGWVDDDTFAPSRPGVGMAVAVKRCRESTQGKAEWLAELSLLGRLGHPNVISLLGYSNDELENLLVYEHMQNGSFSGFLFPNASAIVEPLSWITRLDIMMSVARGVTYLHSPEVQVIYRGLKSSIIFLDQDFKAKLGDFELARSGPRIGNTHVTTHVKGTFGFLDPEYFMTGRLTMKSDIYNFGVVLLETLTGQRTTDAQRPEDLATWVRLLAENGELRKGVLKKIMDPRLQHDYPIEGALKCVAIALRCVAQKRKDRPTSEEVLCNLEQIHSNGSF